MLKKDFPIRLFPGFLLILTILLYGCNDILTDNKAKKLIIKNEGLPKPSYYRLARKHQLSTEVTLPNGDILTTYYPRDTMTFFLESKGLIKVTAESGTKIIDSISIPIRNKIDDYQIITLTKRGKKYLHDSTEQDWFVKTHEVEFDKITHNGRYYKNVFQVDYTVKPVNLTPFGECLGIKIPIIIEQSEHRSLRFSYDKGWKVIE